nr:MAG: DNA pilot protein [Microvirus sp.]
MGFFDGITNAVGDVFKAVSDPLSAIAPVLGAAGSYFGTQQTNSANAAQSQAQMDFQAQQSATAYQRAVKDMQAAGLNPMLAYSQGGASTPSGAMATMQNSLGSAVQGAHIVSQAVNNFNQNDLLKAQTVASEEQANLAHSSMLKTNIDAANEAAKLPGHQKYGNQIDSIIKNNLAAAKNSSATAARTSAMQPEANAIGKTYKDNPNLKTWEKGAEIGKDIAQGANSAVSAITRGKASVPRNNYRGQPVRPDINSSQPPME